MMHNSILLNISPVANKYRITIASNGPQIFLLSYNTDLRSGTIWLYVDLSWLYWSFVLACLVVTRIV